MRSLILSFAVFLLALSGTSASASPDGGVIVFGGTGRLGAPIVKLLVDAGEHVTVFVRDSSTRDRLAGMNVEYAVGDLNDEASIAAAFDAAHFRVAIDASAQRGAKDPSPTFYEDITRRIVTHAKRTGVKQFIHHGSIGAGDNLKEVPALANFKATPGLIDKGKAESVIVASGLPYTIIRNGLLPYDPQPPATQRAILTSDISAFGEVTRDDLAIFTLDAMDNPARINRIYHAYDPALKSRSSAGE
ncbi:MAG: NAD(P)H-binding protein [Rhodobacteraceae bacterium]|nr:NAD(P)H-binding protein [Paracoccaceae bacterium]